jgi:hypothetical protein
MHPKTSRTDKKNKEEDHDNNNNLLAKEIDTWSIYEYALREENRLLFEKMLSECKENEDFAELLTQKMSISQLNHCLWR